MQPPREFLIFRLWGPMASWGEIAVGERRGSWSRPSRSAILGLVAAALGLERADSGAHLRLEAQLGFAVRIDDPGKPLRDYHTAQSPSQRKGMHWATRREELGDDNNINTILSERSYYIGMDAVIILWPGAAVMDWPLEEIAARLIEPVFTPYLGRKACPLGLPLAGAPVEMIFRADSLLDALQAYDMAAEKRDEQFGGPTLGRRGAPGRTLWLSERDADALGLSREGPVQQRSQRRDRVRDRSRWLFDDRVEVAIGLKDFLKDFLKDLERPS